MIALLLPLVACLALLLIGVGACTFIVRYGRLNQRRTLRFL